MVRFLNNFTKMEETCKRKFLSLVATGIHYLIENNDLFEEESDSSDEEIAILLFAKKKDLFNKKQQPRVKDYIERTLINFNARQFQSHFRVSREAYETILFRIGPLLSKRKTVGRSTISVEKQLLSVLWILATPDSYRSVCDRFDMGKSSLSVSFFRVIKALNSIAHVVIKWPTIEEMQSVKHKFQKLGGIENVIGAIDGTYIPIKAPLQHADAYITRKCYYAMTLQAICDSTMKITDAFVGYPGSVSDARIFRNSDIYKDVKRNKRLFFPENEFIVGDKIYPNLSWCITPFVDHGNLDPSQRNFNFKISQTRQVIERCFALLFGRFRRLKYLDMHRTDCIPMTILACCILHNICLNFEDLLVDEYINIGVCNVHDNDNDEHNENRRHDEGNAKRNELCARLRRQN